MPRKHMYNPQRGIIKKMTIIRCHHSLPVPINGSSAPTRMHATVAPKLEIRHKSRSMGVGKSQFHAAICSAENAAPIPMIESTPKSQARRPESRDK
jgi:hypothetical protein